MRNATARAIIKPIQTLASQALHNRQNQGILLVGVEDCNDHQYYHYENGGTIANTVKTLVLHH